ncbi:PREDICTED: pre-rRNA-processing protein esf1-like [Camelina sativa]|uniref:Pre-rRNA-processing protein esf1-like n=1 Tax=Camelina sativa TaxID=90675 RepID=A0ABM0VZF3_CAMSA|nr:PREDICTED: pre-rRNA-processing protein esf1-like [Camelina sativa]
MGSNKKKKQSKGEGSGGGGGVVAEEGNQMINDPRFSSAHTDPRFRSMPRRQSKVAIDSRFKPMFSDKRFTTANAPVDKRGKRRKAGKGNDLLRDFYRLDEEDNDDAKKKKEESGDESENEMTDLKSEAESEKGSDTDKKLKVASLDEESNDEDESDEEAESEEVSEEEEEEEEDTDEDDEGIYEDDGPEIPEENIPTIPEETPRLAIVNMDWKHVSAKDLYVVLNSFLPKDGRILSVAVYPSEFGLQRMKEEEIHGPLIDGDKKKEDGDDDDDDDDEEEEDEHVINQKLRVYELSRLKYYFAVAECDSSATADYLYKSCDGIEFERSSNKLDLRFIPDSMEFKHPPRDIASEAPAGYEGLDFQSRALQLSKVQLSWDDDEPHRIKTLKQNFNSEQLADLEMKEFLASDESESDDEDDEDNNEGMNRKKVEKSTDKYRALIEPEGVDSDKDVEEENDQDMEVTFNTGLEDLSKEILKKKDRKSESVWESSLRQRREKKRARKNNQNDDDDDDYIDRKAVKDDDGDDDFFMEEPPLKKKKKEGKTNKKKKGLEDEVAAEERSRAVLELLLADENAGDGNEPKGFNIKRKGKRGKTDISEEKIPAADLDDPRFSALLTSPAFALDPTDPQFKRSATYARQIAAKRKEVSKSDEDVKETAPKEKEQELNSMMGSKKERHSLNSTVKSLKMKMINKESEKKQAGNAVTSSSLAQRIKKKAKDLSKK